MMTPLGRRERLLVALWLVIGLISWNGIYDLILGRGIKEYLFRSALHEAGRGPQVTIATVLDPVIADAIWKSTFWAAILVLAGLITIRMLGGRQARPPADPGNVPSA